MATENATVAALRDTAREADAALAAQLAKLRAALAPKIDVTPEPKKDLDFASVNLGIVTGRWDTEGTQYVTACVKGGPMDGKWVGLVFFKSRTFVTLATGMFLRVGISFRHTGTMPVFNVGWAELRGWKGMGFKAGMVPVVVKPQA